jgi:hypothetical protein
VTRLAALLVVALTACGSATRSAAATSPNSAPIPVVTTTSHSSQGTGLTHLERASVLAAAVAERVLRDNSMGSSVRFDRVNIVVSLGTPTGSGVEVTPTSPLLTTEEKAAIQDAVRPTPVTWVESVTQVLGPPGHDLPTYLEVGAIVTLGIPEIENGSAKVYSELWCGGTCGIGSTYLLERNNSGTWKVTGVTGPGFIA